MPFIVVKMFDDIEAYIQLTAHITFINVIVKIDFFLNMQRKS